MLQTFILKISRTPYYSSSWDVPILLYESLKTLKRLENKSTRLNRGSRASKIDFRQKSADRHFFGSRVQTSSAFSTPLEPINAEFLPDGTIYSKNPPRKWIQIQIRTDGLNFNLQFKSLASPLRRRPWKWRFPEHRITLRVGMCPSCSTSHWKHRNGLKINRTS